MRRDGCLSALVDARVHMAEEREAERLETMPVGTDMKLAAAEWVATPLGIFVVLALAAYLEVQGDACFQAGLYRSAGLRRVGWLLAGTAVLACYSLFLNSSKVDFGKLLGIYVMMFFVAAQIVAGLQFHQLPTRPIYLGGAFVVAGGLIMTFWRSA